MSQVLATERLVLTRLTLDDAPFILALLNEPSFHEFIGDRGVRDIDGAKAYILNGPAASYERHGFGLYLVSLRDSNEPIGMCGLLRRDALDDADLGYAFLPQYWGHGYATEAARSVTEHAKRDFGLTRLLAIVSPGNHPSTTVLRRLGFQSECMTRLPSATHDVEVFALAM